VTHRYGILLVFVLTQIRTRPEVSVVTDVTVNQQTWRTPPELTDAVQAELARWGAAGHRRVWDRDASLWTGQDEAKWLGWLDTIDRQRAGLDGLRTLQAAVRQEQFTHALLLGMGGSSLCPEVLSTTFGRQRGFPEFHVLDSTVPEQVLAVEGRVDLARTLVIVASKSGSTLEPNVFKQYFLDRMIGAVGKKRAGQHFVAITDPGSKMQKVAEADGFRHIAFGDPTIGGRYSALSPFGTVPAAVMGLDVDAFLARAAQMQAACGPDVTADANPGLALGVLLGVAATHGRDKLTLLASPGILGLGAWLEQLVAESTGKDGKAIVPVDLEPTGAADSYGTDRVFAYLRLVPAPDPAQEAFVAQLEAAGQPVVRIDVLEPLTIGQEFFRWEFATAVAGAIMGIHPFNQPDVEASKIATRELTSAYEREGKLPEEDALVSGAGLTLFTDRANADALAPGAAAPTLAGCLQAHLARLGPGDYFALLAYVEMNARHAGILQRIRQLVREQAQVATCLGFGPRFLHSTGQAYKGGSNRGVFLQITCDDARDVTIPGAQYSFGVVKTAQARGDFDVLAERGRRALRVHVGADVAAGLQELCDLIEAALQE
jgi:transaldolase/glucose-6-phosphate isomerase